MLQKNTHLHHEKRRKEKKGGTIFPSQTLSVYAGWYFPYCNLEGYLTMLFPHRLSCFAKVMLFPLKLLNIGLQMIHSTEKKAFYYDHGHEKSVSAQRNFNVYRSMRSDNCSSRKYAFVSSLTRINVLITHLCTSKHLFCISLREGLHWESGNLTENPHKCDTFWAYFTFWHSSEPRQHSKCI